MAPDIFDLEEIDDNGELIASEEEQHFAFKCSDVWSFAMVASYLFSGFEPWTNKYKNNSLLFQKLLMRKVEFPIPVDHIQNSDIVEFIKAGTFLDRKLRKNIFEMNQILSKITI